MESPNPETRPSPPSSSSSHFLKTVCLRDWWLIKSEKEFEGKRLAVAGLTSKEQLAVRVFSSAPIIKRHDVFTLETSDGICILIKGFINKLRTCENGFSSEVFKYFLFGFPPQWEDYAVRCLEGDFTPGVEVGGNSTFDKLNMDSGGMRTSCLTSECTFLTEESPSQCEKVIREDMCSGEDILDQTNVQVEGHRDIRSNEKYHNYVACGKSFSKECTTENVLEQVASDSTKGSDLQSHDDIGLRVLTSQNQDCLKVLPSPANINVDIDTESRSPSNMGSRPVRSNQKNQKGCQKEWLATRSNAKNKNNEHNGGAAAFQNSDEKLKRKSSTQIGKKNSNAKGAGIAGTKRKLKFDIHVSPLNQEVEKTTSPVSSESRTFKRSRSGRLLLPTLHFWRNQKAVYDVDRQITAIQEGHNVVEISGGSKCETHHR